MDFLIQLFENSQWPFVSAFALGIMTALSPCPLATNITAIGFLSKDIENKNRVFTSGLIYTAGRAISYTVIGLIFFFGASQLRISGFLQQYGERFIGPLLIIIGLFMLGVLSFNFPGLSKITQKVGDKGKQSFLGALLLGILFALAFCPYSGVLYFGMLIPMTISSASGLYLPIVFALATGIPVILFAWMIAFSMNALGNVYNRIKVFERWFRRVVGVLFIGVGIYYVFIIFIFTD